MKRFLLAPCVILLLLNPCAATELPEGVTVQQDIAYGADPAQRIDVYLPPHPQARRSCSWSMAAAGAWATRTNERVVENKVAHWVPQGVIFVSVNYRMIPEAEPLTQAEDVARALAKVQELAPGWGGDPANIILMGHSAGAHLVALVNAAPEIAAAQGAKPWKGAVLLDSGAMNVPAIMNARHPPLYDKAFGDDPAEWQAASPFHRLAGPMRRCSPSAASAATSPARPTAPSPPRPTTAGRPCRCTAHGAHPWRDQHAARPAERLHGARGCFHARRGLEAAVNRAGDGGSRRQKSVASRS